MAEEGVHDRQSHQKRLKRNEVKALTELPKKTIRNQNLRESIDSFREEITPQFQMFKMKLIAKGWRDGYGGNWQQKRVEKVRN